VQLRTEATQQPGWHRLECQIECWYSPLHGGGRSFWFYLSLSESLVLWMSSSITVCKRHLYCIRNSTKHVNLLDSEDFPAGQITVSLSHPFEAIVNRSKRICIYFFFFPTFNALSMTRSS
jgi:hypothetical protein